MKKAFVSPLLFCLVTSASVSTADVITNSTAIEEVVVTGEFRDTSLLKLPTSISVVDEDALRLRNAKSLEDVLNLAPNVNYASGASRGRYIQIRGIGERSQFSQPVNPSVGVMVDGIDFTGMSTGVTTLDTQQVEIFRGPQGTLYGANALAGLIYVNGNTAGDRFEGEIETTQGNYNRQDSKIVVSTPISSTIGWRLAVSQSSSDGYMHNAYLNRDNTNNIDEFSARNVFSFDLADDVSLDLTSFYIDVDNGYDAFSLDNNRTTLSDQPGKDTQQTTAHALKLNIDTFDLATWETTLSYAGSDTEYSYDEDWSYTNLCIDDGPCEFGDYSSVDSYLRNNKNKTLDTRLISKTENNLNWVAGLYYRKQQVNLLREYTYDADYSNYFETKNTAIYGELTLPLVDTLEMIVGLRGEQRDSIFNDTANISEDRSDRFMGGKFVINFQYLDNAMGYALISRGYKAGGVNNSTEIDESERFFDDEYMWNWELGHKSTWFDGNIQSQIALFYQQRDDLQVKQSLDINEDDENLEPNFLEFLDNGDSGYNYGIEAGVTWLIVENIQINSSLGLLETGYDNFINCSHQDRLNPEDEGYDADISENNCVDMSYPSQAHAPTFQY